MLFRLTYLKLCECCQLGGFFDSLKTEASIFLFRMFKLYQVINSAYNLALHLFKQEVLGETKLS